MSVSKAWDWSKETDSLWRRPSEESYAVMQRWKDEGVKRVLDLGCGLGRHAVYFAKQGFDVSACDLSREAVASLQTWAEAEGLPVRAAQADMTALPYADGAFDAVFAYHVISHTDTAGIRKIIGEIARVLRPGGELYATLCSKETWSFRDAGYPRLDANTIVKTDDGPEKDVPHFYATLDELFDLFHAFEIEQIRHVDDCYFAGRKQNSKHYYLSARLRAK